MACSLCLSAFFGQFNWGVQQKYALMNSYACNSKVQVSAIIIVFFFVEYPPEDGLKRPKYVVSQKSNETDFLLTMYFILFYKSRLSPSK